MSNWNHLKQGFFPINFQVENFLKRKEELFGLFYDLAADIEDKEGVEGTEQLREDVEKLREEFSRNAKETWNTVMSQEMTLVTQTEQVKFLNVNPHFFQVY